ncbi:MAG: hypothetical protein WCW93_03220 [Candidatus Paceibacterota bacterium]
MENNQKGFVGMGIIIAIIAVLAIGGVAYYVGTKNNPALQNVPENNSQSQIDNNASTSTIDKTANWKTYTNTKYGFEVKYPENYSIIYTSGDSHITFRSNGSCQSPVSEGGEWPIDCQAYDILIQQNAIGGPEMSKIFINGIQAEKFTDSSGMWSNGTQILVQFQKGQNWYIQTFTFNQSKSQTAEGIMNKILSTFKFTEPTTQVNTSNWQTFKSAKYGFEIQYPSDLNYYIPNNGESSVIFNNTTQATGGSRSYKIIIEEMSGTTMINGVEKQTIDLTPKDMILNALNQRRCNTENSEINWVSINTGGVEGIEATTQSGNACLQTYLPWAAYKKDNKIYYIESSKASKEEFNQILSTFKFTEPTTKVNTTNWKTYTDAKYNFAFSYPLDFALSSRLKQCNGGESLDSRACLEYTGNQTSNGFTAASIDVRVNKSMTIDECQKTWPTTDVGVPTTQQKTINGIIFYHDLIGSGAAGMFDTIDQYRTYRNGTCYTIALDVASNRGQSEKGLSNEFSDMMLTKLQSVLSTFKFIK